MNKKTDWQEYKAIVDRHGIKKLYHFTDFDNLKSIINNGGLYSWKDCDDKGICIPKPGGGLVSRDLDSRDGLERYVRVSFVTEHPMMYVAMNDGRISNPVILEINPEVIWWEGSKYSDRNATKNGACVGDNLSDFKAIHFDSVKVKKHFDLDPEEQMFFQAEILVKNFIPLEYITNISNFGIPIPSKPATLQSKVPYTSQITRNTPTAFLFLIDQSVSMKRTTTLYGDTMTLSEAVARIVNSTINELVLRCVKSSEVRHYYDIALIGYGEKAYSAWEGNLEGHGFVSPEEIKKNPYKRIVTREEVRTRKGVSIKEIEKDQWLTARHDGRWTHYHDAFDHAKSLLNEWLDKYHNKDCYPPTIINITDGEFNGATKDVVLQKANELKSMFTNDGNVILFNIHITPSSANVVFCPASKDEVSGYSLDLFEFSSLLPMKYNDDISRHRNDIDTSVRHAALSVNADMATLIQMMDIGTPTNISQK